MHMRTRDDCLFADVSEVVCAIDKIATKIYEGEGMLTSRKQPIPFEVYHSLVVFAAQYVKRAPNLWERELINDAQEICNHFLGYLGNESRSFRVRLEALYDFLHRL